MDPTFSQPPKAIPVYRATYYCGQKCTWPSEEQWKIMKAKEAEVKRKAKKGKSQSTKVIKFITKFDNFIFYISFRRLKLQVRLSPGTEPTPDKLPSSVNAA
jgi:hypothetical protein